MHAAGGLQAVHLRHLDVHEDDVVRPPPKCLERLDAVHRDVGPVAQRPEHPECDLLVNRVVLDEQDAQPGQPSRDRIRLGLACVSRASRLRADHGRDGLVQLGGLDRLRENGRELAACLAIVCSPAERRQHHQRQRVRIAIATDLARQGEAVHLRHLHVEDRDVERIAAADPFERLRR